jgi:hypothetical protein
MKYPRRLLLVVFASACVFARGQEEEERHAPPIEIPDFSNLDEYIYEPKSTVRFGFRNLGGAKVQFSGNATIASPRDPGPATGANQSHYYHDGAVLADTRKAPRKDSEGNPMLDPESGTQISDPIAPDGRTNNWAMADDRQVQEPYAPNGFVAFHSYSAEVVDPTVRDGVGRSTAGIDLSVSRDMGKLFGTRFSWAIVGGMSVNDLSGHKTDRVLANMITTTDLYSLYGQTPPAAPYTAPSTTSQAVYDASGNPLYNSDGSLQVVTVDNSVLIGNTPASRQVTTTQTSVSPDATTGIVTSSWKLKGAFYSFRVGPELWIPISSRFRAILSFGPVLIYSGTTYTLNQTFLPDFGPDVTDSDHSVVNRLTPGFFADASLQYDLTDKAGFFAGAVYQTASTFTQRINTESTHAATKVDFSNMSGIRAGMSIRF